MLARSSSQRPVILSCHIIPIGFFSPPPNGANVSWNKMIRLVNVTLFLPGKRGHMITFSISHAKYMAPLFFSFRCTSHRYSSRGIFARVACNFHVLHKLQFSFNSIPESFKIVAAHESITSNKSGGGLYSTEHLSLSASEVSLLSCSRRENARQFSHSSSPNSGITTFNMRFDKSFCFVGYFMRCCMFPTSIHLWGDHRELNIYKKAR